jgi:hypothetical protein
MKLLVVHAWSTDTESGTYVKGFDAESKERLFLDLTGGLDLALRTQSYEATISGTIIYVPAFTIWDGNAKRMVIDFNSFATILTLEEYFDYVR